DVCFVYTRSPYNCRLINTGVPHLPLKPSGSDIIHSRGNVFISRHLDFLIRKKAPKQRLGTLFKLFDKEVIFCRTFSLLRLYTYVVVCDFHYFKMNSTMSLVHSGPELQSVKLIFTQQVFNKSSVLYNIHNYSLLKPSVVLPVLKINERCGFNVVNGYL